MFEKRLIYTRLDNENVENLVLAESKNKIKAPEQVDKSAENTVDNERNKISYMLKDVYNKDFNKNDSYNNLKTGEAPSKDTKKVEEPENNEKRSEESTDKPKTEALKVEKDKEEAKNYLKNKEVPDYSKEKVLRLKKFSLISSRKNAERREKLANITGIKKLNYQSDIKALFEEFSYVSNDGNVEKPFEKMRVSDFTDESKAAGVLNKNNTPLMSKYLILALSKRSGNRNIDSLEGLDIDRLKAAENVFDSFIKAKEKRDKDPEVFNKAIEAEAEVLRQKRQNGEIGSLEFYRENKKLVEKVETLKNKGLKINFSQTTLMALYRSSPTAAALGDMKDHAGFSVKRKWKEFWRTRKLRRGLMLKGAWEAIKFPPRYAIKIPAQLLGYRFFMNRIRKKRGLSPLTITSDFKADMEKLKLGFAEYSKAPETAKKEVRNELGQYESKLLEKSKNDLEKTIEASKIPPQKISSDLLNQF